MEVGPPVLIGGAEVVGGEGVVVLCLTAAA